MSVCSGIAGAIATCGVVALPACAGAVGTIEERRSSVTYGADDRREYFELVAPELRSLMAESVVALIAVNSIDFSDGGVKVVARSWGEVGGLCAGEPFFDQPAAAFCSGVLLDWDLVLTAGHCARVYALEDFVVVFNYDYRNPGELAVVPDDILGVESIVNERLDPQGVEPRVDYAWLRLRRPVTPPRRPIAVHAKTPDLRLGDPITAMAAIGGVPVKADEGGRVRDPRDSSHDYFVADTDTSGGSSGGGAFDHSLGLLGILARGAADVVPRGDGCNVTNRLASTDAREEFTYAHKAVEGLCTGSPSASSLCRSDCGDPCVALPPTMIAAEGGCSLIEVNHGSKASTAAWALLLVLLAWRTGRRGGDDFEGLPDNRRQPIAPIDGPHEQGVRVKASMP